MRGYSNIRRRLAAAALAVCLALSGTGCAAQRIVMTKGFSGDEIFRIGDAQCTEGEYKVFLLDLQKQCERLFGHGVWETKEGDRLRQSIEQKALSEASRLKVMMLLAIKDNIMLTDAEESQAEEAARVYYEGLSPEEKEYLGLSEGAVKLLFSDYLLAQKVYGSIGTSFEERYDSFSSTLDYDINESVWDRVELADIEDLAQTPGFSEVYRQYFGSSPVLSPDVQDAAEGGK